MLDLPQEYLDVPAPSNKKLQRLLYFSSNEALRAFTFLHISTKHPALSPNPVRVSSESRSTSYKGEAFFCLNATYGIYMQQRLQHHLLQLNYDVSHCGARDLAAAGPAASNAVPDAAEVAFEQSASAAFAQEKAEAGKASKATVDRPIFTSASGTQAETRDTAANIAANTALATAAGRAAPANATANTSATLATAAPRYVATAAPAKTYAPASSTPFLQWEALASIADVVNHPSQKRSCPHRLQWRDQKQPHQPQQQQPCPQQSQLDSKRENEQGGSLCKSNFLVDSAKRATHGIEASACFAVKAAETAALENAFDLVECGTCTHGSISVLRDFSAKFFNPRPRRSNRSLEPAQHARKTSAGKLVDASPAASKELESKIDKEGTVMTSVTATESAPQNPRLAAEEAAAMETSTGAAEAAEVTALQSAADHIYRIETTNTKVSATSALEGATAGAAMQTTRPEAARRTSHTKGVRAAAAAASRPTTDVFSLEKASGAAEEDPEVSSSCMVGGTKRTSKYKISTITAPRKSSRKQVQKSVVRKWRGPLINSRRRTAAQQHRNQRLLLMLQDIPPQARSAQQQVLIQQLQGGCKAAEAAAVRGLIKFRLREQQHQQQLYPPLLRGSAACSQLDAALRKRSHGVHAKKSSSVCSTSSRYAIIETCEISKTRGSNSHENSSSSSSSNGTISLPYAQERCSAAGAEKQEGGSSSGFASHEGVVARKSSGPVLPLKAETATEPVSGASAAAANALAKTAEPAPSATGANEESIVVIAAEAMADAIYHLPRFATAHVVRLLRLTLMLSHSDLTSSLHAARAGKEEEPFSCKIKLQKQRPLRHFSCTNSSNYTEDSHSSSEFNSNSCTSQSRSNSNLSRCSSIRISSDNNSRRKSKTRSWTEFMADPLALRKCSLQVLRLRLLLLVLQQMSVAWLRTFSAQDLACFLDAYACVAASRSINRINIHSGSDSFNSGSSKVAAADGNAVQEVSGHVLRQKISKKIPAESLQKTQQIQQLQQPSIQHSLPPESPQQVQQHIHKQLQHNLLQQLQQRLPLLLQLVRNELPKKLEEAELHDIALLTRALGRLDVIDMRILHLLKKRLLELLHRQPQQQQKCFWSNNAQQNGSFVAENLRALAAICGELVRAKCFEDITFANAVAFEILSLLKQQQQQQLLKEDAVDFARYHKKETENAVRYVSKICLWLLAQTLSSQQQNQQSHGHQQQVKEQTDDENLTSRSTSFSLNSYKNRSELALMLQSPAAAALSRMQQPHALSATLHFFLHFSGFTDQQLPFPAVNVAAVSISPVVDNASQARALKTLLQQLHLQLHYLERLLSLLLCSPATGAAAAAVEAEKRQQENSDDKAAVRSLCFMLLSAADAHARVCMESVAATQSLGLCLSAIRNELSCNLSVLLTACTAAAVAAAKCLLVELLLLQFIQRNVRPDRHNIEYLLSTTLRTAARLAVVFSCSVETNSLGAVTEVANVFPSAHAKVQNATKAASPQQLCAVAYAADAAVAAGCPPQTTGGENDLQIAAGAHVENSIEGTGSLAAHMSKTCVNSAGARSSITPSPTSLSADAARASHNLTAAFSERETQTIARVAVGEEDSALVASAVVQMKNRKQEAIPPVTVPLLLLKAAHDDKLITQLLTQSGSAVASLLQQYKIQQGCAQQQQQHQRHDVKAGVNRPKNKVVESIVGTSAARDSAAVDNCDDILAALFVRSLRRHILLPVLTALCSPPIVQLFRLRARNGLPRRYLRQAAEDLLGSSLLIDISKSSNIYNNRSSADRSIGQVFSDNCYSRSTKSLRSTSDLKSTHSRSNTGASSNNGSDYSSDATWNNCALTSEKIDNSGREGEKEMAYDERFEKDEKQEQQLVRQRLRFLLQSIK